MTITVVGHDLNDINARLGRIGPAYDILIRSRRGEDYGRVPVKGGILVVAGQEVPTEHATTDELIAAVTAVLRYRDELIDKELASRKAPAE